MATCPSDNLDQTDCTFLALVKRAVGIAQRESPAQIITCIENGRVLIK
jgi:hypothetical protein